MERKQRKQPTDPHILYKRAVEGTMYFDGEKWTADRSRAEQYSEEQAVEKCHQHNEKYKMEIGQWLNRARPTRV